MPSEKISFEGHSGETLAARLDLPEGPHLATALFAHCFTCGKDIHAARRIAQRLASMGIAVLRFDFTGLGHSQGEFANTTFSSNVADLVCAARHLEERGMAPGLLIGHSLGGAAVIRAAGEMDSVRAVATIGAPHDPEHVTGNFREAAARAEGETFEADLGGRKIRIGKEFIEDVAGARIDDALAGLKRALLILHAPRDAIVGIDNAARNFQAAKHPKSFVTLDDADHLLSRAEDAEYAAEVICAWANRYLELADPEEAKGGPPEGIVRVSESDPGGFLQDVQHGPLHHALADEPEAFGGSDRGMSPYGFVAAGLGACTSMTIRMYARRKKWPLDHVSVDVCHDKVHAEDAGEGSKKIDRFVRTIRLKGDLTDEQRARILEIADKCPVHQTLSRRSEIETREG